MKSGTAAERAYDKAYRQTQNNRNSPSVKRAMEAAKRQGGSVGRAIQRGINHANGRNG